MQHRPLCHRFACRSPPCRLGLSRHSRALKVLAVGQDVKKNSSTCWDAIIVGSGIIGLYTATQLLESGCSVVLVEQSDRLCAGATGAGQGYIWQIHRDPLVVGAWKMAEQSRKRWQEKYSQNSLMQWDMNGSLLLATTSEESAELEARANTLKNAGLTPRYLSSRADVVREEPSLENSEVDIVSGLIVESDAQISGKTTAEMLYSICKSYGSSKFLGKFSSKVDNLLFRNVSSGGVDVEAEGVCLGNGEVIHGSTIIVSAGAWTSNLIHQSIQKSNSLIASKNVEGVIVPRRGHLLVLSSPHVAGPSNRLLSHGIMESSYTKHYKSTSKAANDYDITFTATENVEDGTLLIGSSRELKLDANAWSQEVNQMVVNDIMASARRFLPDILSTASIEEVRVGLRPYALGLPDHRPYIGPVSGIARLFVAAGHEGSGLTLAPITADIILYHASANGYINSRVEVDQDILRFVAETL
jgi:glycine/D-amino acid oxidase-like deaminating enzyme